MSKDWGKQGLPLWTSQYSVQNRVDALDCASESMINIIYMMTGFDGSPRALAKLSGTTTAGNTEGNILKALNTYGIIRYPLWTSPDYFDWASYYNDVPPEVLSQAVKIQVSIRPFNLNVSPGWTVLQFPNGALHLVAQINNTQYFDSEVGSPVKNLTYGGAQIINQVSVDVNIKLMNLVNDNGTWKIVGDKGYIGIADPQALAKFQQVTSQFDNGTPGVPQVGVFKSVEVDKNTTLSLLVND